MSYTVNDYLAARALCDYWALHFHKQMDLKKFGEGRWQVSPSDGCFPPVWREICDAFIGGYQLAVGQAS